MRASEKRKHPRRGATTEETTAAFPEELSQIPEEYFGESERPGTLVELEYDTYESMSYEEREGGTHSGEYAMEYFYNGLCWIWQ